MIEVTWVCSVCDTEYLSTRDRVYYCRMCARITPPKRVELNKESALKRKDETLGDIVVRRIAEEILLKEGP